MHQSDRSREKEVARAMENVEAALEQAEVTFLASELTTAAFERWSQTPVSETVAHAIPILQDHQPELLHHEDFDLEQAEEILKALYETPDAYEYAQYHFNCTMEILLLSVTPGSQSAQQLHQSLDHLRVIFNGELVPPSTG